jgi:hypothetical protein
MAGELPITLGNHRGFENHMRFCHRLTSNSLTSVFTTLPLILGPCLLPALALEHADCAAILGIEHGPSQHGLLTAVTAYPNWIGFEAGKDFVFEVVIHRVARR